MSSSAYFGWRMVVEAELADERSEQRSYEARMRAQINPLRYKTERRFIKLYRLSKQAFEDLRDLLHDRANLRSTQRMSLEAKILCALLFYAKGGYQCAMGEANHVSQEAMSVYIEEVTNALNHPNILERFLRFPTTRSERDVIKQRFYSKYGIPGVIGCIDGCHFKIFKPKKDIEHLYYCRKNYHSINAQVICDADTKILAINAKFGGSSHDSFIWENSNINNYMQMLHRDNERVWLLGDSGYPQRPWIMTPYTSTSTTPALTPVQELYNEKHRKARVVIENTFGRLKNRWRCCIKYRAPHYKPPKCAKIITACCVLHNIAVEYNVPLPIDDDSDDDSESDAEGIIAIKTPTYARNAVSMILHIMDCYLEEISKVSQGTIPPLRLVDLLHPFCRYMCFGCEPMLCARGRRMLTELMRQSDHGLRYQGKTRAWEQMGCPEGGPDALQEVSDDDNDDDEKTADEDQFDDDDNKPLDPRAGRVDVELTPLPVPAARIAALLASFRPTAAGKARTRLNVTIDRFKKLAEDEYPLKVEEVILDEGPKIPAPGQVAKSLQSLEKQLAATSDELALRGLSRKHRKRLLAKTRAGISILDDPLVKTRNNAAGDWTVEETTTETNKNKKQDTSNKENFVKKQKKRKIEPEKTVTNKKRKIDNKSPNNNETKKKQKTNEPKTIPTSKQTPKEKQKKAKTEIQAKVLAPQPKTLVPQPKTAVKKAKTPTVVSKKVKNFQKQLSPKESSSIHSTPKRVKFVLKNNSMQETVDYYRSVRQSPNIPFDSKKAPAKTNLKPTTPSPINPFFKNKWKLH